MAITAKSTIDDIVSHRRKLGMNQSEFWRPLGVTQSGGSRYESGRALPKPVRTLLAIAYGTEAGAQKAVADLRKQASTQRG